MRRRLRAGEPFLEERPSGAKGPRRYLLPGHPFFCRKLIERDPGGRIRVFLENPPRQFQDLGPRDFLDVQDLIRFFRCSRPTLERCIYDRGLQPSKRVGQEMFFRKAAVLEWLKAHPWPGRAGPRKVVKRSGGR